MSTMSEQAPERHKGKARTPRFATRILVKGPECPADLRRMDWIEWTGVPGALGVTANMAARRGGWRVEEDVLGSAMARSLSSTDDMPCLRCEAELAVADDEDDGREKEDRGQMWGEERDGLERMKTRR